jgi:hypothetical protein
MVRRERCDSGIHTLGDELVVPPGTATARVAQTLA